MAVWVFVEPAQTLRFDQKTRSATLGLRYPFGIVRTHVFAFSTLADPQVVWNEDSDIDDGGYWALKVDLPNGRKLEKAHFLRQGQEKSKAQEWCDEIFRLMRPAQIDLQTRA